MKYLTIIDTSTLDLEKGEEDYLDLLSHHDHWCKKNRGRHGRTMSVYEAIKVFKDDIYQIALELAKNDDNKLLTLLKDKSKLDYNEKLQRAKQVPIESLITTPIRQNKTLCPFHEDSNASMHVYIDTNSYYCFTCCSGGDVIDYVMNLNKCNFIQAINLLT